MSDPNLTPPSDGGPRSWSTPPTPPAPPDPWAVPAPGQEWGVPGQQPPTPQDSAWGAPPPAPPGSHQPGGYQQPAQPYQYGYGIPTQGTLATPGKRILARIVDWLIMIVVIVPLYLVVIGASTGTSSSDSSGSSLGFGIAFGGLFVLLILVSVGQVLYEVGFIALKGATPGKMLLKVRVVRESDGQIPGWGPAFMRWLPTLVSLVPCVGGLLSLGLWIWALVNLFSNPKRQTPFDLAAKTVVVAAA